MIKANEKRHPWHDISYGEDAPDEVYAVIECPKQSNLKYELEKESGFIKLDRVLYSAVHYPGDYGFIPRTLSDDNDPLDIIILSNFPVAPGVIVRARPIGVIEMVDNDEKDAKIVAVHDTDPRFDRYNNITDVSENIIKEIRHFFQTYKQLQDKKVEILSIKNHVAAKKEIRRSIKMYEEEFLRSAQDTSSSSQNNVYSRPVAKKRANVSAKAVPKKVTKKTTRKSAAKKLARVGVSKRKRL